MGNENRAEQSSEALRFLIAEDEWLVAIALRQQLESCGWEVVGMTRTGPEAVELCRTKRPDVVLMDTQMPGRDGLAATAMIMESCPTCVIIVTSAGKLEEACQACGAMGYVVKPLLTSGIPRLVAAARARFEKFMQDRKQTESSEEGPGRAGVP